MAPSFWAWKGGEARLGGLANFVDHIFCILPNEEAVCNSNGLPATFVGHPTLEDVFELNLVGINMLSECIQDWRVPIPKLSFFQGSYEIFKLKYSNMLDRICLYMCTRYVILEMFTSVVKIHSEC